LWGFEKKRHGNEEEGNGEVKPWWDGSVIVRLFFLQGYGEIYFSGKNKIMFIKRTIVF
jgi:hypothetical protein